MSSSNNDAASSVGDIIEERSEPDTTPFKCLFCSSDYVRVPEMFAHCQTEHKFDVEAAIKNLGPGLSPKRNSLTLLA
jgi:protein arginine N-methyltransferase 3